MARCKQTARISSTDLPTREEVEAAYTRAKRLRTSGRINACTATHVERFLDDGAMDKDEAAQCSRALGDTFPLFNTLAPLSEDEIHEISLRARREAAACSELRWAADLRDLASRREFLQTLKVTYLSRQRAVSKTMHSDDDEWVYRINYLLWCEGHARVFDVMERCAHCPEYEEWWASV